MDLVYIGKYINTHGLKGEIKIKSDFKYKDIAFKLGNNIIIDGNTYEIENYRVHKELDMLRLVGIRHIEQIQDLKGNSVYMERKYFEDLLLDSDLIGMNVYSNKKCYGKVTNIKKGIIYDFIEVNNLSLVPNIEQFIENIDIKNKRIDVKYIKGLLDEN